ncbi:protein-glutamine gamma-glutamyltransferase [Paenibacillus sp. SYP-B3998]|uniref:Protein-glutamine gamma-glutamyltransferase n=1 Tax=Paenibacillus sp. SYP-B3998 TaxID=2678564 RepID=A0A6G4A249_9BACL|nr:protein-glutamine gamma-glutamyltransferase [Paenibacillus sp. SYP-B3998]NEW08368.1 protein-glutamine gamma-glutamyltransferase [Paenibacillus sp. SYP-B3998]
MIVIARNRAAAFDEGALSGFELTIYQKKKNSSVEYEYDSDNTLLFELQMRTHIMESSLALSQSGVYFAGFKDSQCNEAYWHHTHQGRFQLKAGVSAQDAIRDIFRNGNLYAFECSTAIVVILYKAILESIDPKQFDRLFSDLLLFDKTYNKNLHLNDRTNIEEAVTGDVLYFDNPEFSPLTPWWRGQNAIKIENGLYYGHGHGTGIVSAEEIIAVLNLFRKPDSTQSAFLTQTFVHPNFSFFSRFQSNIQEKPMIAKIGAWTFVG